MSYGGGYNNGGGGSYSSPGGYSGGNRKRGRDVDDSGSSGRSGQFRRHDYDQPLSSGPRGGYDSREFSGGYGGGRRGRQSYGGGGGGGYGYHSRNKHDPRDFQVILSVGEKYCVDLWRFGDELPNAGVDEQSRFTNPASTEDLEGLKQETRDIWSKGSKDEILRGFRIAVAECPHKLPHFATLLALLAEESFTPPPSRLPAKPLVTTTGADGTTTSSGGDAEMQPATPVTATPQTIFIGLEIVKDLVKTFQRHLDARRWRSVRFSLHLFAHLASLPKPLISSDSLLALLQQSFVTALENELGLRAERGDELVRVVLESLLRLANVDANNDTLISISQGIGAYMQSRELDIKYLTGENELNGQWVDPIDALFKAFQARFANGTGLPAGLNEPFRSFTSLLDSTNMAFEPFQLPVISLPPETDSDAPAVVVTATTSNSATSEEDADFSRDQVGYSGTRLLLSNNSFFTAANESESTVPPTDTNDGVYLRTLVEDIINVFEVNRKDCAKILLKDLVRWLPDGTFKSSTNSSSAQQSGNGGTGEDLMDLNPPSESTYILENLLLESILSQIFATPSSPKRAIYYHSLIAELCKVSPQTVAPSLGKCIRKLFSGLGEEQTSGSDVISLNAEGVRRYAEWFSVHLSNFGFHWRWPEWEASLELPSTHPKKIFISRVLELEIRLSYFDRIKVTLPDSYLSSSSGVFSKLPPGPDFEYEAEGNNAYVAQAAEVQRLMRGRATSDEIKELLAGYKKDFTEGEIGDVQLSQEEADRLAKDLVFQCVLVIGSRSFSHFLNILERYLTLLRELTDSPASRLAFLRSCSRFWKFNSQFTHIVFDKLLQYRLVDPIDVVSWVFSGEQSALLDDKSVSPRDWSDINVWEILKMTLEKVQTRVVGSSSRLEALKKKEENRLDAERAALQKPGQGQEDMNVDGTNGVSQVASGNSEELEKIEKLVESVQKEQDALITEVVRRFNETLSSLPISDNNEDRQKWIRWFAVGWFDEFVRAFAKDIYKHADSLAALELPENDQVQQGLNRAYAWVDFA